VSINKKPSNFDRFETKQRAKNVNMGIKNPMVLKNRRIVNLENFFVAIILSLITAEITIDMKQNINGMDDSSPFLN
jgi:hypothetical protein